MTTTEGGKSVKTRRMVEDVLAEIDALYDEHKADPDFASLAKPVEDDKS